MGVASLTSAIIKSLMTGQMVPDMRDAACAADWRVRNRSEGKYWDYKEFLPLADTFKVADLAKDVLAFHNTEGGAFVVGVADNYRVVGVQPATVLDAKQLNDKLHRYVGPAVEVFQDSIPINENRVLWFIFVRKHKGAPQRALRNGPDKQDGKPLFVKGDLFYRDGDQVRRCIDDADVARVFRGTPESYLNAYNYEIDIPYFRLLNPNCEKFIGRQGKIDELKSALSKRQPIVVLDGLGGVGKTAIAIRVVRELYEAKKYAFIVSLSAKSRAWQGYVSSKKAAFSGLRELLVEIASVFPDDINPHLDTPELKDAVIDFMKGFSGLILLDNLEEISDPNLLRFIDEEVPDPVKVLVTSRVDKKIGGKTISIDEMSAEEADDLLRTELERLGAEGRPEDDEYCKEILSAAGGVPLAIKWAAQIAAERKSLRQASSILRGAGSGKQELLNFCFTTMYDALSPLAKDVSSLIPYLKGDWRPATLSIALDAEAEAVQAAIYEISENGIVYESGGPGRYAVLPLTREFLLEKWNRNSKLKNAVMNRFGEMFCSADRNGHLLEWPTEERVAFLRQHAIGKLNQKQYEKALRLVRLAKDWSPDPILIFLEGKVLHDMGKKGLGLVGIRQALQAERIEEHLSANDHFYIATAFFSGAGPSEERQAVQWVLGGVAKKGMPSEHLVSKFIDACLLRRDNTSIARLIASLDDDAILLHLFEKCRRLIEDTGFVVEFAELLRPQLERITDSRQLSGARRAELKKIALKAKARIK